MIPIPGVHDGYEPEEASVQAKRTARGAERDTQPLLLKHVGPDYTFYSYSLSFAMLDIFHIWGHYGTRYPKGPR
jgi:hypothetical protein